MIWGMTEVEQALGKGQETQGGRLEGGVLVWDVMGENVWWVGGGLWGARGVKGLWRSTGGSVTESPRPET